MRSILAFLIAMLWAVPATAQNRSQTIPADTVAGKAGQPQPQNRTEAVNRRIANRIQSRLRNRLDRNYSPSSSAAVAVKSASDAARVQPR